jgi:hypothetical protein
MTVALTSIKFWINAFIPRDLHGLTKTMPKGKHSGSTMIPGPTPVSDCFLTDQKSFSNHINAKSRMHSEFSLGLEGPRLVFTEWHNCDLTCECDCEDGSVECEKKSNTNRMKFTFPSSRDQNQLMRVTLKGAASNPCATGSPDIDYEGTITIDLRDRSIEFIGKVDPFPAFEAYATINNGAGVTMFQINPKAGKTPWNLFGPPSESARSKLRDSSGSGILRKMA